MRRLLLSLVASMTVAPAAIFACSSSSTSSTSTPEAGAETSMPEAGAQDTSADTMPSGVVVGGCTQADFDKTASTTGGGGDFTASPGVVILFPPAPEPLQYSNRCSKVKVGSTVSFQGRFSVHPLQPKGGDTPTPIPSQSADLPGDMLAITFTAKGTFGFQCNFHPSIMFGAIQVVP